MNIIKTFQSFPKVVKIFFAGWLLIQLAAAAYMEYWPWINPWTSCRGCSTLENGVVITNPNAEKRNEMHYLEYNSIVNPLLEALEMEILPTRSLTPTLAFYSHRWDSPELWRIQEKQVTHMYDAIKAMGHIEAFEESPGVRVTRWGDRTNGFVVVLKHLQGITESDAHFLAALVPEDGEKPILLYPNGRDTDELWFVVNQLIPLGRYKFILFQTTEPPNERLILAIVMKSIKAHLEESKALKNIHAYQVDFDLSPLDTEANDNHVWAYTLSP